MTDDTLSHSELLTIIQNPDTDEQLRLMEEVAMIVRNKMRIRKHNILELKGLGKEIWESIDILEHINKKRDSWIGYSFTVMKITTWQRNIVISYCTQKTY
jgi:hypothetical protein